MRTIAEYPNYLISKSGNVVSIRRMIVLRHDVSSGYCQVRLYNSNGHKTLKIHRLVSEAFLDNPAGLKYVNHIDGDRMNNDVSNLEWCSASENMEHAHRCLGGVSRRAGIKTVAISRISGAMHEFNTGINASLATGVPTQYISAIAAGHITPKYGYDFEHVR